MVEHWRKLGDLLGAPLLPVTTGKSLNGLIDHFNALPNFRMRWCTRMLKIEPFYRFLLDKAPATSYVGLRADEEGRAGMSFPSYEGQITVRFPLREWGWGLQDVLDYLDEKGVQIPKRTDCARCYHQTLGEWWLLWHDHPALYAEAEDQERRIGHTFRSEQRDSWPASLEGMRERFERGEVPRGTKQMDDLFNVQCRVCSL